MGIDVKITNETSAKVTKSGELVVAPLKYSETEFRQMNAIGTAFNFFGPLPNQQFVVTGFNLKAARNVSNTIDARVVIFEASSVDSTTEDKILFEDAMIRGERTGYTNTNILVTSGKWINATTSDADVFVSVLGYYIDKIGS
jgi:hypothetical protein